MTPRAIVIAAAAALAVGLAGCGRRFTKHVLGSSGLQCQLDRRHHHLLEFSSQLVRRRRPASAGCRRDARRGHKSPQAISRQLEASFKPQTRCASGFRSSDCANQPAPAIG